MGPVGKGAVIGGTVQAGSVALGLLAAQKMLKGTGVTLGGTIKIGFGSKKIYGALVAAGIGTASLIGAGIGKIVKNHQEKKQMQADIENLKAEVTKNEK